MEGVVTLREMIRGNYPKDREPSVADKISAIRYYLKPKDWREWLSIKYKYFHKYTVRGVGKYARTILMDFELSEDMWTNPICPSFRFEPNGWFYNEYHNGPWEKFVDVLYEKAKAAAQIVKENETGRKRCEDAERAKKFTPIDY